MKIVIKHENKTSIRFSMPSSRYSAHQGDLLEYYLLSLEGVKKAAVYDRTADATVWYSGDRNKLLSSILKFDENSKAIQALVPEHTSRQLSDEYQERIISKVTVHYLCRIFLPWPLSAVKTVIMSIPFIWKGLKTLFTGHLQVPVLDATAITVSMATGDFTTASSVMFLLGIGDILEEWTHKKSVEDLAGAMSLKIDQVWIRVANPDKPGTYTEVQMPASKIQKDDEVVVRMGSMIPFDGFVAEGDAMVNQSSLTGESVAVHKESGGYVYAGTVIEEGNLVVRVDKASGGGKYDQIVNMIEDSQKLKSAVESKAEHMADRLVPYSLATTALVWLFTRNVSKAVSVLMVDFSCALKMSMPVSVLSAMRDCQDHHVTVKGGKYLEAVADADTIVFDKTGTLTKAQPTVREVIAFDGNDPDEMLRLAACLEEHYPHSIANAVVAEAKRRGLNHAERHKKVEYVVAHGIASTIDGQKVVLGSYHFIFEDEKCTINPAEQEKFDNLPEDCSHLYMALGGKLCAVILIEDPLREEAEDVIEKLHEAGFNNIVMMTGDSRRTAAAVAKKVGVDHFYAEVLPADKARFVEEQKKLGHKVVMVGDGINDSPALSAADAGIAISEGASIANAVADITISENNLYELVALKNISKALMKRINGNYRFVTVFNGSLIVLGIAGLLPPSASAVLHNGSTVLLGLHSMTSLVPSEI